MELPKVMIEDKFSDYLQGKEVEATVMHHHHVEKGMHVMGFHHSIAVTSPIAVPKEKQSQYIGVEGKVVETYPDAGNETGTLRVRVVKL